MTDLAKIIYAEVQRCAETNCFTTKRDELKSWFTKHFDSIGFDFVVVEDTGDHIAISFEDEDGQDCEILADIENVGEHTYYIALPVYL